MVSNLIGDSTNKNWWNKIKNHGDIMGISWGYHGHIMGISWGYHGDIVR